MTVLCGLLHIYWVGLDLDWLEEEVKLLKKNITERLVEAPAIISALSLG